MKLLSLATVLQLAFLSTAGVSLESQARAGTPFCFGDGSGTACPCGNTGTLGHGCANSVFASGGILSDTGAPSASPSDTLVLTATNIAGPGLFFQGTVALAGVPFADGLQCVGGTIVRIGVAFPTLGVASYPGVGQTLIHTQGGTVPTNVRHYQCWYRDAAPLFCPPATHNMTNGLTITWTA